MQICPDPLDAIRSIGPDHQWCVKLPASYPTLFPYIPTNNVENSDKKTSNTHVLSSDTNNYDCSNILDSPLCTNNQLIQRIRRNIDLYQTSPLNNARYNLKRPANIEKQHVLISSDSSIHSISSSTQSSSSDSTARTSTEMSISASSTSSTPHVSKQQADSDQLRRTVHSIMSTTSSHQSDPHVNDNRISSALDLKNSRSLPPSYNQQLVDRTLLSNNQTKCTIQSPSIYTSDPSQRESFKEIHTTKIKKQNTWFQKLTNKISFHNLSSENDSLMHIDDRKKQDFEQNRLMYILTAPSGCCRSCHRIQRPLATIAQRSNNIYK